VRARVLSVIDGDTFTITLDDLPDLSRVPSPLKRRWVALRDAGDTALRVRLIGIDAPELDDPRQEVQRFAVESKEFLRALVEGQFVTLIFEGEYFDRYGRLLAYAEKDGSSIEEELLRRGLVTSSTWSFAYVNEYRALGAEARTAKLGLWAKSSVAEVMMGSGTLLAGMEPDILIATGSVKVEPSCESSGTGVVLSEVYPSPPSGGSGDVLDGEWIELFNPTDHVVSLGDWTLDDLPDGGSRPWAFPCDFILGPRERKVVLSQETGLRLNNDGDEVWLTSLDGTPVDHVTYPRISTGLSFSLVATGTGSVWCLSDPTPLEPNTCRTEEASSRSSVHVRRSPSGFLHTRYVMENTAVESGPMRWVAALGTGFTLIGEEVKSFGGGRGHWPFLEWGIALALAVVSSVALWSSPQKRGEDQRRMNKERVINP
jgi:micrococcal nuclease